MGRRSSDVRTWNRRGLAERQCLMRVGRLAERLAAFPDDGDPDDRWRIERALIATEARAIQLGCPLSAIEDVKEQDPEVRWRNLLRAIRGADPVVVERPRRPRQASMDLSGAAREDA